MSSGVGEGMNAASVPFSTAQSRNIMAQPLVELVCTLHERSMIQSSVLSLAKKQPGGREMNMNKTALPLIFQSQYYLL